MLKPVSGQMKGQWESPDFKGLNDLSVFNSLTTPWISLIYPKHTNKNTSTTWTQDCWLFYTIKIHSLLHMHSSTHVQLNPLKIILSYFKMKPSFRQNIYIPYPSLVFLLLEHMAYHGPSSSFLADVRTSSVERGPRFRKLYVGFRGKNSQAESSFPTSFLLTKIREITLTSCCVDIQITKNTLASQRNIEFFSPNFTLINLKITWARGSNWLRITWYEKG